MSEILLEANNLVTVFKIKGASYFEKSKTLRAVNDVSFTVNRGETLGVIGESGCGKSTLGKTVLRLVEPASGEIRYKSRNVRDIPSRDLKGLRKTLQIIFQDPYSSLDPRKTAPSLVEEAMTIHDMYDRATRKARAYSLLSEVGLGRAEAEKFPHEFSGGQRQRINIARALAMEPEFIVCDEPVSALDVSIQAQVLNLIKNLQKKYNLTLLFISHDLGVVRYMSDRIMIMYLGKVVETGPAKEIYLHPRHPYTRVLFSAIPPESPFEKKQSLVLEGELPSPLDLPPGCPLSTRCPFRKKICGAQAPVLKEVAVGHLCACHFS